MKKKKASVSPNEVSSTLFVGLGGAGSKIIYRVRKLAKDDKFKNVQFVVMDTDVNDLEKFDDGPSITAIQTSSSRSVGAYLRYDKYAKENWFPENKILDGKTVSEGAGQVRAISRLALNATIRQGKINELYKAIDNLCRKDGNDKTRAVKVIIASTTTGGTGSGIVLPVAMLIRHYIKKNYPELSAIIRGFLVLPGIMDCVIDSSSERLSQRRNAYATIKELNAFMMNASGATEYEPRLRRYARLGIMLPTTGGADEWISNLPFDFCFLFDKTDSNQKNMDQLTQYYDYIAQSIYEQNIGPMKSASTSKEDNIVKEFINPEKLGRCRFGGAGASVIRYPYKEIREYLAYNWAQNSILGVSSVDKLSERELDEAYKKSWMIYDVMYDKELREWKKDSSALSAEPKLESCYIKYVETDRNDFSRNLRDNYLSAKIASLRDAVKNDSDEANDFGANIDKLASEYFEKLNDYIAGFISDTIIVDNDNNVSTTFSNLINQYGDGVPADRFSKTYNQISKFHNFINMTGRIRTLATDVVKSLFEAALNKDDKVGSAATGYTLASYLSSGRDAMHPNAARYLLYKLQAYLFSIKPEKCRDVATIRSDMEADLKGVTTPKDNTDKKSEHEFHIKARGKFPDLASFCAACDSMLESKIGQDTDALDNCRQKLNRYFETTEEYYKNLVASFIIEIVLEYISRFIKTYKDFYDSFKGRIYSLEKKRKDIISRIAFDTGDCVYNVFSKKSLFDAFINDISSGLNDDGNKDLFSKIFVAACENTAIAQEQENSVIAEREAIDIFNDIIIKSYMDAVDERLSDRIDKDILQAIALEYKYKLSLASEKDEIEEIKAETDSENLDTQAEIEKRETINYIKKVFSMGENLASPSISKNSIDEDRSVSQIALSVVLDKFTGITPDDITSQYVLSPSISKYEAHFFCSIYCLTPVQLAKLCSPSMDPKELAKCVDANSIDPNAEVGDYFMSYQTYMENIGPDSKLNPYITPHIDRTWNSIAVMPELDLEYQDHLMQDIHQSLLFGFLYDVIERYVPSKYDPNTSVYRYTDENRNVKDFIVPNGTLCDRFYEVLDSLYNDRAAVKSIKKVAFGFCDTDRYNRVTFEDSKFAKAIDSLSRKKIYGEVSSDLADPDKYASVKMSLFELPILYYNSKMISDDLNEIVDMTIAIINAIRYHLEALDKPKNVNPHLAMIIVEHHNRLLDNYETFKKFLGFDVEQRDNEALIAMHNEIKNIVDEYLPNGSGLMELK